MDERLPSHHGVHDAEQGNAHSGNDTLDLLKERASCRNFSDEPISEELLNSILDAGRRAATGGNLQPFSIIVIRSAETRENLATMCGQKFMANAPVHLLFCIDWNRLERWAKLCQAPYTALSAFRHFWISFQDTIIAAQNICTAIDACGMGSVYIGTVIDLIPEMRSMFELPRGVFPIVLLCLGWPKSIPKPRRKLEVDIIAHREKYHEISDEELLQAFETKFPDMRIPLSEERIETFRHVCESVTDQENADAMIEDVLEKGYFNPVQRYFGLHYRADIMPQGNDQFLQLFKDAGFSWFEEWIPLKEFDDEEE